MPDIVVEGLKMERSIESNKEALGNFLAQIAVRFGQVHEDMPSTIPLGPSSSARMFLFNLLG